MPEPTDALKLLREIHADLVQGAIPNADDPWWQKTSALLADTSDPLAVEPVAWLSTDCIGERYLCFTKPKDSNPARPLVFGDTTPHPTQAQAGAVPLTDEQLAEMMRETWGCASIAPRHAMKFARAIEAEVRKQDDALILQLVEALDGVHAGEHQGGVDEAITAGRARLEGKT